MITFAKLLPNEAGRHWFSIMGTIEEHSVLDQRNFAVRWLSRKFPNAKVFKIGLHYTVRVKLDEDSYQAAGKKLEVSTMDTSWQIPKSPSFEVLQEELSTKYLVGATVGVSFGISGPLDQFFTGTIPVRFELRPINSEEEFLRMPDPVIPVQRSLFLQTT